MKETEGTLVFDVAPDASKTEVKQAVEALFKVKVPRCAPPTCWARNAAAASLRASGRTGRRLTCKLKAGEKLPEYVSNL